MIVDEGWLLPSYLLIAGTVFFSQVFNTTRYVLAKYCGHRLTNGDIYLISEKVTCSTQAVMAWYTGFLIVSQTKDIMADTHELTKTYPWFGMSCLAHDVWTIHWLTNAYLWFGMPYLAHDIWAMYQTFYWREGYNIPCSFPYETVTHFMRRSWIMILHHVSLAVIFFPVLVFLRGNRGDFFVGCSYMMEISVPFVSVATTLDQLQMKNTRAYLVNGLLMLFAFFCGRILLFPYLYWCYALHAGMGILEVPFSIPIKCNVGCFIALLPQVYWFWSMLHKAVKYLKKNN